MKSRLLFILLFALFIIEAGAFTKKNYYNYKREAVSNFIWGLFSEQLSNSDGVKKYYEKAYKDSKSDFIRHELALELIRTDKSEEGYKILNELYDKGFKLGRTGIYLYLEESKKENKTKSGDILDRIIAEMYEGNEIITAAMVVNQKMTDNMYYFTSSEQFEEYFKKILDNKFTKTYKWYFSTVAMQFYSKTTGSAAKITETMNSLEAEYPELPYIIYRFAFDEYIYLKDFEQAEQILLKMKRHTYGEAKFYSDEAELFASKGDFIKARNILLDGMKEFPESSLNLQLASLYIAQNDLIKAEIIYDKLIKKYPEGTYIHQVIANEYTQNGKIEKALNTYERVLKKYPDDPELLNNYSYQLAQSSKDLEKALEYVEKALLERADSITFLDTKAWVLFKMGRAAEAEKIMDKLFLDKNSFYHSSSEELYEHLKAIKTALNKTDDIKNISINKTAILLSEIFSKSNIILQIGF